MPKDNKNDISCGLNTEYLCNINTPDDLKKIDKAALEGLSEEVRKFLIEHVSETGGHLASNLGVVEMTMAILRTFDVPKDHVIFDVGHQSYVYKMFTGRKDAFSTLRKSGGISGFPKRDESEYDCFGTGHSSTSLSAALGFARAEKLKGSDAYTVVVLGDGAFTGGMIHEALNNCEKDLKLIIILNENEMSISKNIGRFAKNIARMRSKTGYFRTKSRTRRFIQGIPLIGKPLFKLIRDSKKTIKNILYGSNYFEDLGLYYLGPVDGNNEEDMEALLLEAKKIGESVVIHARTQKGCGLIDAEKNPQRYHGILPEGTVKQGITFSNHFGNIIDERASRDEKIVAITAAMSDGTGLEPFRKHHKERFFDVGIAEPHAITFAAGLSAAGYKPVVPIYSTFLQRAYDNIIHDVALQKLPMVICSDRAGLNASDGATHHGIFDVAFLLSIPEIKIYTPVTYKGLELSIDAALNDPCPSVIRYPNGEENQLIIDAFYENEPEEIGVRLLECDGGIMGSDAVIITYGRVAAEAIKALNELKEKGIKVSIILAEYLKPADRLRDDILKVLPGEAKCIVFLEEEVKVGGFGMLMYQKLTSAKKFKDTQFEILAPEESFVIPREGETVYDAAGISANKICLAIERIISNL